MHFGFSDDFRHEDVPWQFLLGILLFDWFTFFALSLSSGLFFLLLGCHQSEGDALVLSKDLIDQELMRMVGVQELDLRWGVVIKVVPVVCVFFDGLHGLHHFSNVDSC